MTTMSMVRDLAPTILMGGVAIGYAVLKMRAAQWRHRLQEVPLGRIAFARNIVRTRQRRSH